MNARSAIFIGDLVRAGRALGADTETIEAIAALLGLGPATDARTDGPAADDRSTSAKPPTRRDHLKPTSAPPSTPPSVSPELSTPVASGPSIQAAARPSMPGDAEADDKPIRASDRSPPPARRQTTSVPVTGLAANRPSATLPLDVQRLVPSTWHVPQPAIPRTGTLPEPTSGDDDDERGVPDPQPLLDPRRIRALISAAVGVLVPGGDIDLDRTVAQMASCEPVEEHRTIVRTMRGGAHLLIDVGEGMLPFAQDAVVLRRAVAKLVGEQLTVLRFVGCPTHGAGSGPRPWDPYRLPPPPTPVLVVSDLGTGRPGTAGRSVLESQWTAFARLARRGRPLVTLVPYPLAEIPARLARAMGAVAWARNTGVRQIRRAADSA